MRNLFFLVLIFVAVACTKERPQLQVPSPVLPKTYSKTFVVNEGIYPQNNSSISLYDETQGLVSSDYFKLKNQGSILGSVPQCLQKINKKYYLTVNNANKIIVLDSNFVKTTEILNFMSPRYILALPNNKAYVSDYISNTIQIINTQTDTKIGTILCNGWTEQMLYLSGFAYVTNYKKNQLYIIDTNTDLITDSIAISEGADAIVLDKNHHIWVMCTSIYNYEHKFIYCINPTTKSILKSFEFGVTENPSQLCINKNGNTLYYINRHVYKIDIDDLSLPNSPFIDGSNPKILYGLGINPSNENIYVSDSKAGQNKSFVYIYKNTGEAISSFESGYFSGEFFFDK